MFVAGQSPQKIKFYLLSGGGQSEAGVVVGQESLVVVRLLGFLDTTTDSRNVELEILVLGHGRFLPVINYCLPHDSPLMSRLMSSVTVNWTGFFRFSTTVFHRDSTWE